MIAASTPRQLSALARASARALASRISGNLRKSKLMTLTLVCFMAGYLLLGYFLFERGLTYVRHLPLIGTLLSERIFYLMFFFFFLMLVFSNTIISYTMLFRSRETAWLMTLPIRHRTLFTWKCLETLVISSWGLIFISTPLLAAYGQINNVDPWFYIRAFLVYLPFVAIPAALAAWFLLVALRLTSRRVLVVLGILAAGLLARHIAGVYSEQRELQEQEGTNIVVTMNQVLEHTSLSVHPLVPSTWMSDTLVYWAKGFGARGYFFCLLIVSYALMGLLITYSVASRVFIPAWNTSIHRRAASSWSRRQRRLRHGIRPACVPLSRAFPLPKSRRAFRALVVKDFLIFWRDPSQWVQFIIIFGLLFIYVLNLRNMGYDYRDSFWSTVIAHLNLGVCSLALSTLTTRFVFPQFSLEGRRLWILGLAPFGLGKIVMQKFWCSWVVAGALTVSLIVLSGRILELPGHSVAFFACAIGVLSVGLTALAIGLGTLFPNLREANPAKIVSGFGGTLCLILSFLYIVLFIFILAIPAAVPLAKSGFLQSLDYGSTLGIAIAADLVLTAVTAGVPLIFALRRVKNLEILGNL
ncbi:MAG TPA: hypothetical protein VMN03_02710 [Burkholderiales bacterium]|nr:hypothetical protein [Burkholderiales bacterium]